MEKTRDYQEGRFELSVFLNGFIVAKRRFNIEGFIEKSMSTLDFNKTMDKIYKMIDHDLKSKSLVYMWYNTWFDEFESLTDKDLLTPTQEPWECTFKVAVSDRGREIASRIWDGSGYPKAVRDKVDLTNKWVRLVNQEGKVEVYDKESFFKDENKYLSPKIAMYKEMIMLKSDVLQDIIQLINEDCSSKYASKTGKSRITDFVREIHVGTEAYVTDIKKYNNSLAQNWSETIKEKNKTLKRKNS